MIKRSSSILILICIILFNLSPIAMAADYADIGDISTGTVVLSGESSPSGDNTPSISDVQVSGSYDEGARGVYYFTQTLIINPQTP